MPSRAPFSLLPQLSKWQLPMLGTLCWTLRDINTEKQVQGKEEKQICSKRMIFKKNWKWYLEIT